MCSNIYDLPQENDYIRWSFSFGFFTIHNIWSFLRSMPEICDISIWWTSLWLFGHHAFSYKSHFLFPSRILVCATAFAAHYLFSFWDLHLLSSLSNKNKRVGRDISTSLRKYQNQHDYWQIIHDKLEDRFTTITQRCQDFSHKDISAKITS